MSEKQEISALEVTEVAPPAYTEIAIVSEETIEALTLSAQCPTWIRRLPLTLPITHAVLSVPTALLLARSLSEAVLIASFYSFVLFSGAMAMITRALRRNRGARPHAARSLAVASTATILWPFMALLVLSPTIHRHRDCGMTNRLRSHYRLQHMPSATKMPSQPFHLVNYTPVVASTTVDQSPSNTVLRGGANGTPIAVVFSSKGSRVLIGSGSKAAGHLNAAVAALAADGEAFPGYTNYIKDKLSEHFVVSSKGVKALAADEPAAVAGIGSAKALLDEPL